MTCTFFGHHFVPKEIEPLLRTALTNLIEENNVTIFYVGNRGGFDAMVRRVLKEMATQYNIAYYVVLAYVPDKKNNADQEDYADTLLPDGIETVPKRFAISYCNKWMIDRSDVVVTYVTERTASGAAKFEALAERKGKRIIRLK